eukprot:symbB.v1.2.024399.t1/scaffold2307.1/size82757/4
MGILRCIDQDKSEDLRMVALNTLLSLMIGGCTLTRCPPTFVVEAGAVAILCKVANENDDATALELARLAPDTMLPAFIEQGSADACIKVLEQSGADPMDQLTALNLLLSLTKRAPAPIAATGAYEVVKGVSNVALIPRRNKIMNFLRPLVHHEGDSTDSPPLTNIRTVSLKSNRKWSKGASLFQERASRNLALHSSSTLNRGLSKSNHSERKLKKMRWCSQSHSGCRPRAKVAMKRSLWHTNFPAKSTSISPIREVDTEHQHSHWRPLWRNSMAARCQ